jgi:hypothetical protein
MAKKKTKVSNEELEQTQVSALAMEQASIEMANGENDNEKTVTEIKPRFTMAATKPRVQGTKKIGQSQRMVPLRRFMRAFNLLGLSMRAELHTNSDKLKEANVEAIESVLTEIFTAIDPAINAFVAKIPAVLCGGDNLLTYKNADDDLQHLKNMNVADGDFVVIQIALRQMPRKSEVNKRWTMVPFAVSVIAEFADDLTSIKFKKRPADFDITCVDRAHGPDGETFPATYRYQMKDDGSDIEWSQEC